jgi:hypothetical protein
MATTTPIVGIALERAPSRRREARPSPASRGRRRGAWRTTQDEAA